MPFLYPGNRRGHDLERRGFRSRSRARGGPLLRAVRSVYVPELQCATTNAFAVIFPADFSRGARRVRAWWTVSARTDGGIVQRTVYLSITRLALCDQRIVCAKAHCHGSPSTQGTTAGSAEQRRNTSVRRQARRTRDGDRGGWRLQAGGADAVESAGWRPATREELQEASGVPWRPTMAWVRPAPKPCSRQSAANTSSTLS